MTTETVTLKYPFTHKGEEIVDLKIRRPKMRDMKKAEAVKDDLEKSLTMIALLAEVEPAVIEELDTEDFKAAADVVGKFMGVSEQTT
jgi:hypothetical protein